MEKIGLIARQAGERDARVSLVVLTAAGKRIYEESLGTANFIAKDILPAEYNKNNHPLAGSRNRFITDLWIEYHRQHRTAIRRLIRLRGV